MAYKLYKKDGTSVEVQSLQERNKLLAQEQGLYSTSGTGNLALGSSLFRPEYGESQYKVTGQTAEGVPIVEGGSGYRRGFSDLQTALKYYTPEQLAGVYNGVNTSYVPLTGEDFYDSVRRQYGLNINQMWGSRENTRDKGGQYWGRDFEQNLPEFGGGKAQKITVDGETFYYLPNMTLQETADFKNAQAQPTSLDKGAGLSNYEYDASKQSQYGQALTLSNGQTISPSDPNYDEYAKQQGIYKDASKATPANAAATLASDIDPAVLAKPGISALVSSGQPFNETDAKKFAYASGDQNYQQYIGGVAGKPNPLYIGSTNWANLQKQYTPFQLSQATIKTKDGIYWNPNANIAEIPRQDPANQINDEAKKIADLVSDAKSSADKFTNESAKTGSKTQLSSDTGTNESSLMAMLQDKYGDSAETIYNDLFNNQEMRSAQSEVNDLKSQLDEYDQQLEELKDDIRREVEGEATESYISALATVRGEKILKAKRSVQRDYDTALANYNGLKENATNLLNVRTKDAETRYNRLFSMLQLQIQQEGTAFNQEVALANIAMSIPEGRSMTIAGQTVKGLKENDNLNVVQFTDASGKTYVIGVDKKTGAQTYKTYIGTSKVAGSGTSEKAVDLNTALYWLSLVKNKDGGYDLNSIPADIRTGVVNVISQNKDKLPAPEKSWWERQKEDISSGSIWSAINPFD